MPGGEQRGRRLAGDRGGHARGPHPEEVRRMQEGLEEWRAGSGHGAGTQSGTAMPRHVLEGPQIPGVLCRDHRLHPPQLQEQLARAAMELVVGDRRLPARCRRRPGCPPGPRSERSRSPTCGSPSWGAISPSSRAGVSASRSQEPPPHPAVRAGPAAARPDSGPRTRPAPPAPWPAGGAHRRWWPGSSPGDPARRGSTSPVMPSAASARPSRSARPASREAGISTQRTSPSRSPARESSHRPKYDALLCGE